MLQAVRKPPYSGLYRFCHEPRFTFADQEPDYTLDEDGGIVHYTPGAPVRRRQHERRVQGRPRASAWLRRLPGARRPGPRELQRLPRPLPALPGGDHRPGRDGVAPDGPPTLPALREGRMVTNSRALRLALNKRPGARDSTCSPTWTASGSSSRV